MTTRRTFRASQVPQALVCHGSTRLIKRINGDHSSSAAHLGNWCHWQAARTLIDAHGALPPDAGLPLPEMPASFKPSGFGRWMADYFVKAITENAEADMAILVEQEFEHAFDRFTLTGHIDAFAINAEGTVAVGADLKTGQEHVDEAEQNSQVLTYLVLLKKAYPDLKKITFLIIQPLNDPDEGFSRITETEAEGEQLETLCAYLERELNNAIDHETELNSDGWKQCRYCPVAHTNQCPAIHEDFKIMKMTMTEEMVSKIKSEPTPEQLADLEIMRKKFSPIFEAGNKALKEMIATNGRLESHGYAFWIEEGNGKTKITDNARATEILSVLPDETFHTLYEFKKEPIELALADKESQNTGQKIPHDSKVEGRVTGKSLFRDRFAGIIEQTTIKKLKMAEVG